jgi:hypothetical protein
LGQEVVSWPFLLVFCGFWGLSNYFKVVFVVLDWVLLVFWDFMGWCLGFFWFLGGLLGVLWVRSFPPRKMGTTRRDSNSHRR